MYSTLLYIFYLASFTVAHPVSISSGGRSRISSGGFDSGGYTGDFSDYGSYDGDDSVHLSSGAITGIIVGALFAVMCVIVAVLHHKAADPKTTNSAKPWNMQNEIQARAHHQIQMGENQGPPMAHGESGKDHTDGPVERPTDAGGDDARRDHEEAQPSSEYYSSDATHATGNAPSSATPPMIHLAPVYDPQRPPVYSPEIRK